MRRALFGVVAAGLPWIAADARAAPPTTDECLAASEASLKLASEHKFRAERAQLLVCASSSCPKIVRAECVTRVTEVNAQIPTLILSAKDATGADLSAVRVSVDGVELTRRLDGTALAVDPGEHTFVFVTAGQAPVRARWVVAEAQKDRQESVVFGATARASSAGGNAGGRTQDLAQHGSPLGGQRIAALITGGVGVVALGVGAVFGAVALSQKSSAEGVCSGATCTTQDGVNKWSRASSSATASTVGLVVGSAFLAGGVALWFTAPRGVSGSVAQVGLGAGSFQAKVTW